MSIPEGHCLQCGESKEKIQQNKYFCVTLTGYETVEVHEEWDRHHYRDWSDTELRREGLDPIYWNAHRRSHIYDLEWPARESDCLRKGHMEPDLEYSGKDRCPMCFTNLTEQRAAGLEVKMRTKEAHESGNTK